MKERVLLIDEQVAEWLAKQPKKIDKRRWQSDELTDRKILAAWPVMTKEDLAGAIGICRQTLARRYKQLQQMKGKGPP